MFLWKDVLKVCSRFAVEYPCRSAISIKLLCDFIEIALQHKCTPVNLLHIFRTPFHKNTLERLLLLICEPGEDSSKHYESNCTMEQTPLIVNKLTIWDNATDWVLSIIFANEISMKWSIFLTRKTPKLPSCFLYDDNFGVWGVNEVHTASERNYTKHKSWRDSFVS